MTPYRGETLCATVNAFRSGQRTIGPTLDQYLDRISRENKEIGAFLHVMAAPARERSRQLQHRLESGEWPGPLTGIPIAIKDNISVAGAPLTAGSRILEGFEPAYSATVIDRLERSGAIILGKTNLDEFAMGSSTEFSAYSATRNPYDPARVPGGSSGGSAAAVAARFALGALGSDTGGSVRQPAAFCGLVGFKPAYGAVSRYGLIAFASSMDQIGPLATNACDCAAIYNAIVGYDPNDATSCAESAPVAEAEITAAPPRLRIAMPAPAALGDLDAEVKALFCGACEQLGAAGHQVQSAELTDVARDFAIYHILADGEASSNLSRYDGIHYGPSLPGGDSLARLYRDTRGALFGREVKRRILTGTFVLSAGYYDAYYRNAQAGRDQIRARYERLYEDWDLVLTPTTPTPAFRLGEKADDPLAMYRCDRFTIAANLTGDPAISFPIGRTRAGLPVGAQLTGPRGSEQRLFQLAHHFDQTVPPMAPGIEAPAPEVLP